ncbi:MAG: universal stress protein [Planctomycetota bacterium]
MKLLERLLVALDFGPRTDSVVSAATGLAKTFDSRVHLLHVLPEIDDASPDARELMRLAAQGATAGLAEVRNRLLGAGVQVAETKLAEGSPFDMIIRHAETVDANVIVVGARGSPWPGGMRLGTTAERLCRKATKPVWIVQSPDGAVPKVILCPVDGSSASKRALRNAIHLARRFAARLYVLHAIRPMPSLPGLMPAVERGMAEKHGQAETAKFEAFIRDFDFHGLEWQKLVRNGMPEEVILTTASETSADLVVMGSVGRTGLSRILLGSVAGKVAQELSCSVIMVKSEDAIRLKLDEELSDLNTHYNRGCELLENGFLDEARRHFEHCIQTNEMFAPAWEGLAEACMRLGDMERADECRANAHRIEEALAWRLVEADIRRNHPLWKR